MNSGQRPVLTNVRIFRSIAEDAYRQMAAGMAEDVRAVQGGAGAVVETFDPEQLSFKQAMISVVFTCVWLEATLHLLIVRNLGREAYTNKVDRSDYAAKLTLLACGDGDLLRNAERLQAARRDLIHEKAHFKFNDEGLFTGEIRTAQDEAENARAVMLSVEGWFGLAG